MPKSRILATCVPLFLVISILNVTLTSHAQQPSQQQPVAGTPSNTIAGGGNSIVSITASITVPVTNETAKLRESMLKLAVNNLINSGANVLKGSDDVVADVKTKILNHLSNDTQNVQGSDATNAITGVEVGKALKSVISLKKSGTVTIVTSSTCKPSGANSIACDNSITIQ